MLGITAILDHPSRIQLTLSMEMCAQWGITASLVRLFLQLARLVPTIQSRVRGIRLRACLAYPAHSVIRLLNRWHRPVSVQQVMLVSQDLCPRLRLTM